MPVCPKKKSLSAMAESPRVWKCQIITLAANFATGRFSTISAWHKVAMTSVGCGAYTGRTNLQGSSGLAGPLPNRSRSPYGAQENRGGRWRAGGAAGPDRAGIGSAPALGNRVPAAGHAGDGADR